MLRLILRKFRGFDESFKNNWAIYIMSDINIFYTS